MENYSNRLGVKENRLHSSSSVIDMNLLNIAEVMSKSFPLKLFSFLFSQWSERAFCTCIINKHCQNNKKNYSGSLNYMPMT